MTRRPVEKYTLLAFVREANGRPLQGGMVRAFHLGFRSQQILGEAISGKRVRGNMTGNLGERSKELLIIG